jgi:hypothetical protein
MKESSILTLPLDTQSLWEELDFTLAWLISRNIHRVEILYGFPWGIYYYPEPAWTYEEVDIPAVMKHIKAVEARGLGLFGDCDFNLKFGSSEMLFCHHSDVHLTSDDAEVIHFFRDRWMKEGVLNSA